MALKPEKTGTARGLPTFARKEGRYLFLLVSLLLLFFFYPFFEGVILGPKVLAAIFFAILLSGVHALRDRRRLFRFSLGLALVGYGSFLAGRFVEGPAVQAAAALCFALFFGLMTVTVVARLWRVRTVTVDSIFGSMCAYLLLGMTWTMIFVLIESFMPGSYAIGGQVLAHDGAGGKGLYADFIYYSFVTLSTLGYGDISPLSHPARSLAALEAVAGQMFIAVLVARMVGMQIAASEKSR